MDSKRKMSSGGSGAHDEVDDRASKRRKLPDDEGETPQTTKELGLRFLETIKKTEDKNGRLIATAFLELPNRRQLPEYYKEIKLPIALDIIEAKLQRNEFPTLTSLESYFKRMILNAKEFNEKGSIIYDDAERLRKALSNYMTKINPAYKTPGFVCHPTPLAGEGDDEDAAAEEDEDAEGEPDEEVEFVPPPPKRRGRPPKNPQPHPLRNSSTPVLSETQNNEIDYSGLDFQQAQEKIMVDLLNWKEFPGDQIAGFHPFIDLLDPNDFKEYYQIIKHPVSIKQLHKRVKGVHGKKAATGISDFKHWAAFEEEMSYLWRNAFEYNQDGSDIFVLAELLQKFFYKCLKEAKKVVPEPAGTYTNTKIKLKMPEPVPAAASASAPKITLKFGGAAGKASPADSPAPQTNGSNGSDTPVNGTARRNPFGGSSSTPVPALGQLERARSMSGSVASPTPPNAALVKNEEGGRNSPAIAPGYRGPSQAVSSPGLNGSGMPPPLTPALSQQSQYSQGGYAQSFNHQVQPLNQSYESQIRQPGKDATSAMITNVSVSSHPGLNISKHFRMNLPPSPTKTQQSVTINLPATHYYLQIKPAIAPSLRERQYKLFVTCGTQRLHAMPTIPGQVVNNLHPLFDARILPGVNRIEIELIAALPKGAPKLPNGQDYELEKITIFANLMKS